MKFISMKRKMLATSLLFFSLSSNLTAGTSPCKDDLLESNFLAELRLNWAERCHIVPKTSIDIMKYYQDENGDLVIREKLQYPTFARRVGDTFEPWEPDYASCDLPGDVIWLAKCA